MEFFHVATSILPLEWLALEFDLVLRAPEMGALSRVFLVQIIKP